MRKEYSTRACKVLYNLIMSNSIKGTVLMPANICESVPATYLKCGMEIQFCDIDSFDWQIDKDAVLKILSCDEISVLHYNHTYGYQCEDDYKFISLLKDKYPQLLIIDDKCLCFPEMGISNMPADVVIYSTGNVKCVDISWGGYAFIRDQLNYESYKLKYEQKDEIMFDEYIKLCHKQINAVDNSVILSNWLCNDGEKKNYYELIEKKQTEIRKHKKEINAIYQEIPGSMGLEYCNWRYQLLIDNPSECINMLFNNGLFCSNHYKSLGNGYFSSLNTPNCNWLEKHIINLFNDHRCSIEQAKKTVKLLKQVAIPVYE